MAWYNPLTWFKNTPSNITNQTFSSNISNLQNEEDSQWEQVQWAVQDVIQETPQYWEQLEKQARMWDYWLFTSILQAIPAYFSQKKTESIYTANKDKEKTQLSWFSLDSYNIDKWLWLENSVIDHSVDIEEEEEEAESTAPKSIQLLDKSIKRMEEDPASWIVWLWWAYLQGLRDVATYLPKKAIEVWEWVWQAWKELWQTKALENKYWWDLEFNTTIWLDDLWWDEVSATIKFNSQSREELLKDMADYMYLKDAYNDWNIWESIWESTRDAFYDKYKDKFSAKNITTPVLWPVSTNGSAFQDGIITKWKFFDFIDNEITKQWEMANLAEQSELAKALSDEKSQARLSQAVDYSRSVFWPAAENSHISTVEARQEFMNDATKNAQETYWRWNTAMTMSYREKSHLQRLYNTTDLSQVEMSEWYEDVYNDIQWGEKAFEQFIKNHSQWLALTADYTDPDTWLIDRAPDAIIDPETWQYIQYSDFLFKGIDMEWHWLPWIPHWVQSPQDVLDYNSRKISYKVEQTEWTAIMDAWEAVQYGWANVWAFINEAWQQAFGRILNKAWNIIHKESNEVPFAFSDMDTSIMATMTTNSSMRWRLMQNYFAQVAEYAPEVWAHVIVDYYIWKWLNNLWEFAQLRTLWWLNKIPWVRNTVEWRQFAQLVSYVPRWLQLIWTDQTIDAIASIADSEHLSDFSKKISVWWTLLWEWIWMMRDLWVLVNSFLKNFDKTSSWSKWYIDPIRLIADNPEILDKYAAAIWRTSKDASWKIVWDQYKLLLQDLKQYSKSLNKMVDEITVAIKENIWNVNLSQLNQDTKQATYNVLKQVFHQDSAMAKAVTALLTDSRANIADMVKYIWDLDWTVRIWPWISTIKLTDRTWNAVERTVQKYAPWMDLVVEWWLVRWINRWLTKQEIDNLVAQWFINQTIAKEMEANIDDFFSIVSKDWANVYYPTEKWLEALWVETNIVWDPLAIITMSKDTRELIDKLKTIPSSKRKNISDNLLELMWETNAIDTLARNIADIDILDICK